MAVECLPSEAKYQYLYYEAKEELTRLRAENERLKAMPLASESARAVVYGEKIDELRRQNAELAALCGAKDSELRDIVEWARVEKAPLRAQEIESIKRVIALTGPDALKAHDRRRDAETLMKAADAIEREFECAYGEDVFLRHLAERVEKGEPQ